MSAHLEHQLQTSCSVFFGRALPLDATWTSVAPESDQRMSVAAGARRKARGCRGGWPDMQVIYRGQFHGIELKIAGGKQSENQVLMQQEIERAGGKYAICRSVEDVERQLIAWGIPLRAHTMAAQEYDERRELRLTAPHKPSRPRPRLATTRKGLAVAAWGQRPRGER